jgi:hypothetical protein
MPATSNNNLAELSTETWKITVCVIPGDTHIIQAMHTAAQSIPQFRAASHTGISLVPPLATHAAYKRFIRRFKARLF